MTNQDNGAPPHFVVIIPGYMGSKLRDTTTDEIVWIDLPKLVINTIRNREDAVDELFDKMAYPNENLEPAGIMDQVIFAPPLFKQEHYKRLLEALEDMGYNIEPKEGALDDPVVYTFDYDWRQDNRISAQQLGEAIVGWQAKHPGAKAWLIGHSNGGIIARWYIEKKGGKDHVERLFLMGSPWDGAPKAIQVMTSGLEVMFSRLFNLFGIQQRTKELIRSYPSFYQLIPYTNPFLRDPDNRNIDLFSDTTWLETEQHREMLLDGLKFNQDLGTTLSVETLCFFGYRKETTTGGIVHIDAGGRWTDIEWDRTEAGDGTVPERSAVHPDADEKLPYCVGHGDIYINRDVLEKLEWEMVRKYRAGVLADVTTGPFRITFEPQADVFAPGESIQMWATIEELDSTPVFEAQIIVDLVWRDVLPGHEIVEPPVELPSVKLMESDEIPGRYEANLAAPKQEGYYLLQATVQVEMETPVQLEELILVESEPVLESTKKLEELEELEDPVDPDLAFGLDDERHGFGPGEGDGDIGEEISTVPGPTESTEPAERVFEIEIQGHDMQEPLQLGQRYPLTIGVALRAQAGEIVTRLEEEAIFKPEEQWVELWVHLSTRDFKMLGTGPQRLVVPRFGPSWNKAAFIIKPIKYGIGEISVRIHKDGNFVHGMTINLNVGRGHKALVSVGQVGHPLNSAEKLRPRDINLFIRKFGGGFDLTLVHNDLTQGASPDEKKAVMPITLQHLDRLIADARKELEDIVYLHKENERIKPLKRTLRKKPEGYHLFYQQEKVDIPEDVHEDALRRLAVAGWYLYNELFYEGQTGYDAWELGDKLRELAQQKVLSIQIVSQEFMFPWGLLYMSEDPPLEHSPVDPQKFLGFKHIVEHLPLQQRKQAANYEIPSKNLQVSLNLNNTDIPIQLVSDQQTYWKEVSEDMDIRVITRTKADELLEALKDPAISDQILYFYCHAVSRGLDDKLAGPSGSALHMSGKTQVTLKDLKLNAPTRKVLEKAPLVFINACESAELSPLFYAGFMPYFTRKGARGVIGTECKVPAGFAATWAKRFFEEFLAGEKSIGEIFLLLRQEFLVQHRNLLGLMYALYCDGDTRLEPGLH